ncbi:myosin heavy chain kinase c-like protein [Leptomonas seymouri]|uniref:Myosin heavy chain kinase c-like protein n=1 Tax=Leptomonas seymouri TaxID=5684 RepID=A0A0N1HXQ2_LEPSE|nr:myosin heavy chain kinase c-like protein [Leptomonas seymouri]|eukprot:KPI87323.1 myosin heavy chain kinase c-like protein [Leptomonas seymouri]
MGSSPLSLREEAAITQQRRAETTTGTSDGTAAAIAGLSSSLSNSRLEGDSGASGRKGRRQISPLSNPRTPHRGRGCSRSTSIHSKDGMTPHRLGAGAMLLPLIPAIVGSSRDAPIIDLQGSSQHLIPCTSSSFVAAGQPLGSPDYCAQRQRRPSMSSARDASAHIAGLNNSCGSFTLSPTRSTRDISATGLRGPIPENAVIFTSLKSPLSQSRSSCVIPTSSTPVNAGIRAAEAAATAASSPQAFDEAHRGSGEAQMLPLLTRSLVSLSSGTQSRRLTGALLDASVNGACAVVAAATPHSLSISSMSRSEDGAQQPSSSKAFVDGAGAAAQVPLPQPPASSLAPSPPPLPPNNSRESAPRHHGPGGGSFSQDEDFDGNSHQQTNHFTDDHGPNKNSLASPRHPTEPEVVTFSMMPVVETEDILHGESSSVTAMEAGCGGSHSLVPVPDSPTPASATGSAVISGVYTPPGGSIGNVQDTLRRASCSIMKSGSGDLDYTAAATAARCATGARCPGDSITEAVRPKVAKRRLKKEKKAKKAKHQQSQEAAVDGAAANPRSDSEMQRRRQRKKQEKREKLKKMSTEEQRRYKAEHQRRRAAKKAQRSPAGASPAPEAGEADAKVQQQVEDACGPTGSSSAAPLSQKKENAAALALTDTVVGARAATPTLDPLGDTQPPASSSPKSPGLKKWAHNSSGTEEEAALNLLLAMSYSTPQLANTDRPSGAKYTGEVKLQDALRQVRRCTSAKSPSALPAVLSETPLRGSSDLLNNYRRRVLSEAAPSVMPQYRPGRFLSLPSDEGTARQQEELQKLIAEEAAIPGDGANAFDIDDEEDCMVDDCQTQGNRALYGNATPEVSLEESAMPFASAALTIIPHPPAAAAGSGATAIFELKQQHRQHQQLGFPTAQLIPSPPSTNSAAHHTHDYADKDQSLGGCLAGDAASSGAVVCPTEELSSRGVSASSIVSSPVDLLVTPSGAVDGSQAILEELSVDEASSRELPRQKQQQLRSDAKVSVSASLPSCSSYSHSMDGSVHRHRHRHVGRHSDAAVAGNKSSAQESNGLRRRFSAASSCSSFRSRSDDGDSDVGGSSSYSYSYTSSTSSSGSSVGDIIAEVLPLKEGCTTAPPTAAFHDLNYRYSSVSQLQAYAEPAVIHEWDLTEGCWGSVKTTVVLNPQPFSKGNMRASYYMIDMRRLDCLLVAKRYLKSSVGEDQYFDDVSMHSISGHWARIFNAMNPPKKVRFVPAAVLVLTNRSPPLFLAMEPLLTGKFVKYNNNCGYVRRNARWTPQAFSHFTYQASKHELMVVDIQGVDDYYTDPQILSPDGEGYGRGNLGRKGIRRFLESHKCNDVCRAVGLPPLRRNSKGVVTAPLVPSKSANGGSRPDTPAALERHAAASFSSCLKDERLPPKVHTMSQYGLSNNAYGSEQNLSFSGGSGSQNYGNSSGLHKRVSSLADGSHPGSEVAKLGSSRSSRQNSININNNAHYHSGSFQSPSPAAAPNGSSGYANSGGGAAASGGNSNPMSNHNGGSGMACPPSPVYGVKYMPYPRNALVRQQSQYFTSTIAGGLMAVPPTTNGSGALSTTPAQALHMASGIPGSFLQQQQQQQQQHSPATPAAQAGAGGMGTAAVPLLRPLATGRANGAGGGYPAHPPNVSGNDGFVGASAQKTSAPLMGLASSPRREPAGGGTPGLHPHPPRSRVPSLGAVPVGTPVPPAVSAGGQNISQTNSSITMYPAGQVTQEMPMSCGLHQRRQSFSRRPVFSAVEEIAKVKPRRHHRR